MDAASFNAGPGGSAGDERFKEAMGFEKTVRKKAEMFDERRISRKARNRLLAIAFMCLLLDAILSFAFALMAPADQRLADVYATRQQARTILMQGVVAAVDAVVSFSICIHVIQGILSASLDAFLEGAATKLLQSIFFSLLQTGYPTLLRLSMIAVILLLRVSSAALIFRAAFLSGVLTARPARELPRLIVALLELGAPVPAPGMKARLRRAQMYAIERPLNIELIERLIRWLVPVRERAAAVGMGRRQVLVIAAFLLLMTSYAAFAEYWSILGDQDEFFVEGQRDAIVTESFSYLSAAAYAAGTSAKTVEEARPFLSTNATSSMHRVVVIVLSGLRFDAFDERGMTDSAALHRFRESLGGSGVLCKMRSEVPSLGVPNWIAMLFGLKPEIHGLLGQRGPAEQPYSSVVSVASALGLKSIVIGTPWFVDLVRSHIPFGGDGSVSPSWREYEANTEATYAFDKRREEALFLALNTTSRLILAQFSELDAAGVRHGASYQSESPYSKAIKSKAALLDQVRRQMAVPGAPPTTLLVVSDHGHLQRGGSGGQSDVERDTPMLAYRRGSDLNARSAIETPEGDVCLSGRFSTIDVAPTISALLAMPVPRHSQGAFIPALFDHDEAKGYPTDDEYSDVRTRRDSMGPHLFRQLETWMWRDMYHQQHAFISNFFSSPDVNKRALLDDLDTNPVTTELLELAEQEPGDASAYSELLDSLTTLRDKARNDAASGTSARNQLVATFILGLVMLLVLFAMQLQTFCDPLVVLLPSGRNGGWARSKDYYTARRALLLVMGYYAMCIAAFIGWLIFKGLYWSASIVAVPEHVRNYLLVCILPGIFIGYGIHRSLQLKYAVWPTYSSTSIAAVAAKKSALPETLKKVGWGETLMFLLFDEIQAYEDIDLLYLSSYYLLLWTLVAVCILGILSSKFSFIVPLVFYNKFVDDQEWDYRFVVMTVQVMTVPLLVAAMLRLSLWPRTKVDLQAMNAIHQLKVDKADRRAGTVDGPDGLDGGGAGGAGALGVEMSSCKKQLAASCATDADAAGQGEKAEKVRSSFGISLPGRRRPSQEAEEDEDELIDPRYRGMTPEQQLEARFDDTHQLLLEYREERAQLLEEIDLQQRRSEALEEEYDQIVEELKTNQGKINSGVKELETMIIRRFEAMQEAEQEAKRNKEMRELARGEGEGGEAEDDEDEMRALDPAARRAKRRERLVAEQRKRIAQEEAEKAEADAKIRALQAELAKLLEANGRMQRKVEACEHNIDETADAIEDMEFQTAQVKLQMENQLAVLEGETTYLTEHLANVQRKSSELQSKMTEIEASISANGYQLQRVTHQNELATADQLREIEALEQENAELKAKFERVRDDVKVLYGEKIKLNQQLATAKTEADDVEKTVTQYRKSAANLIA